MSKGFSIIIPTCNREHTLLKCLDKVQASMRALPANLVEVIVTDDGNEGALEEKLFNDYSWVSYTKGPQKGPAANRNHGASKAQYDWLVFTDDDCLPDTNWLSALQTATKHNMATKVFEGRTYAGSLRDSLSQVSPENHTGGKLWSCNFAIEKTLFFEIGGFDERFLYASGEDEELRTKLKKSGLGFVFVPEAAVCHPWRKVKARDVLKKRQEALFLLLSIHPELKQEYHPLGYLKYAHTKLLLSNIPELFRLKGKGFTFAITEYLTNLQTFWRLLITR